MAKIILASQSPRRKEILHQVGIEFECFPSDNDEICSSVTPYDIVVELAEMKAKDVAKKKTGEYELVIGADTIVACDDKILGKPADCETAFEMLSMLQGRSHQVYTGVALVFKDKTYTFYKKTEVYVYKMTDDEIYNYISTGEPMDKAGAYAIQGKFASYIEKIEGDYYNVVGLPVSAIVQNIKSLGREELL